MDGIGCSTFLKNKDKKNVWQKIPKQTYKLQKIKDRSEMDVECIQLQEKV